MSLWPARMKTLLTLAATAAVLASCGDSSNSNAPKQTAQQQQSCEQAVKTAQTQKDPAQYVKQMSVLVKRCRAYLESVAPTTPAQAPQAARALTADFDKKIPKGVDTNTPVRVSGISVGHVSAVGPNNLALTVDYAGATSPGGRGVWPPHADAQVLLRRLPGGKSFYVDLRPGTSKGRQIPWGSVIGVKNTRICGKQCQ